MKKISILGSTGSIGAFTLDILARFPDRFTLSAVSAHTQVDRLASIARTFKPALVGIGDVARYRDLKTALSGLPIEIVAGPEGLQHVAEYEADAVVCAIVGLAGLNPSLAAVRKGQEVILANKECLVAAGPLFLEAVQQSGATLLPVDSEHNALFQLIKGHAYLNAEALKDIVRLTITASGGPLWQQKDLHNVSMTQACQHPVWPMGTKISIDSATMVNKALELAEACYLFEKSEDEVDILVHPQSFVHAMVHYASGVTHTNMSVPDMRTVLAHALFWPQAAPSVVEHTQEMPMQLIFEKPDDVRFPAIPLMRHLLREKKPLLLTALNAANEMGVSLFQESRIGFLDIVSGIARTLDVMQGMSYTNMDLTLEAVGHIDQEARKVMRKIMENTYA